MRVVARLKKSDKMARILAKIDVVSDRDCDISRRAGLRVSYRYVSFGIPGGGGVIGPGVWDRLAEIRPMRMTDSQLLATADFDLWNMRFDPVKPKETEQEMMRY